jgi:hypothetical protein
VGRRKLESRKAEARKERGKRKREREGDESAKRRAGRHTISKFRE